VQKCTYEDIYLYSKQFCSEKNDKIKATAKLSIEKTPKPITTNPLQISNHNILQPVIKPEKPFKYLFQTSLHSTPKKIEMNPVSKILFVKDNEDSPSSLQDNAKLIDLSPTKITRNERKKKHHDFSQNNFDTLSVSSNHLYPKERKKRPQTKKNEFDVFSLTSLNGKKTKKSKKKRKSKKIQDGFPEKRVKAEDLHIASLFPKK